jgi:hypothetical protein
VDAFEIVIAAVAATSTASTAMSISSAAATAASTSASSGTGKFVLLLALPHYCSMTSIDFVWTGLASSFSSVANNPTLSVIMMFVHG